MDDLCFRLFGKFSGERVGLPLAGLEPRKARELLCFLLLQPPRPQPREALAAMLWPEIPTAQSRLYLRKTLWQLQAALADPDGTKPAALSVDDEWVQFSQCAGVWVDTATLERAYVSVEGVPGEELSPTHAAAVRAAVELYQGDLLEGWYHDWCVYERERLQCFYLALLDKLIGHSEICGAFDEGLRLGLDALRYDPAREQTHRRLMRLYALHGDRSTAMRQYDRCAAALRSELDVEPTDFTRELYRQIRDDAFPAHATGVEAGSPGDLQAALDQLQRIHGALRVAQNQVQRSMRQLGASIGD
jgi:DNA-binding SARP family transcriptional activator